MGAGESTPAAQESVSTTPMGQDEVLHTLEKVVSNEYGKIQDELAASATQHAESAKAKTSVLKGKFDYPNAAKDAGCKAERDMLVDCLKKNPNDAMECKNLVDNFNMCAVAEIVK